MTTNMGANFSYYNDVYNKIPASSNPEPQSSESTASTQDIFLQEKQSQRKFGHLEHVRNRLFHRDVYQTSGLHLGSDFLGDFGILDLIVIVFAFDALVPILDTTGQSYA